MGRKNSQGQILVEVALVFLLVILIFFAALTQLSKPQQHNLKYRSEEHTSELQSH